MPRKEANPAIPAPRRRARPFVAVALGIGAVAGIAVLGTFAAALVGSRDRYRLPLAALDCAPPPWVDRETFLAEVRFLGDLPDTFNPNEPSEVGRLKAALAKHPWVDFVADDGYVTVANRYPLTVGFRRPALVVTTAGTPRERSVDAKGVLLPVHGPMTGVARLLGEVEAPTVPPGAVWDHPTVRRAVELAVRYGADTVERAAAGWRIARRNGPPLALER